jgi:O-antigen ligase
VTSAATVAPGAVQRNRLAIWCGAVMVGAAVLVPPLAWLAPLGFAPLLGLMGLLCLPALRFADEDRPVLIVLTAALIWAGVSTVWSPSRPKDFEHNGALQLALALPLYWSAVCGARRADPRLSRLALTILGWGAGLLGAVLIVEVATGAKLYERLHEAAIGPIRIDWARRNVALVTFIQALLWPAALAGAIRRRWELALLALAVVGQALAAHVFKADAPLLAIPLAGAAMLVVLRWPTGGPRLMAAKVAALSLLMPAVVWWVRAFGDYGELESEVQLSWGARMSYWSHTLDWILERPLRGWGLDASRAMGAGIQLHPHNGALQIWLELGLAGAAAAAAFWGLSLARLARPRPSLAMAGVAGSVTAYILFAWLNFGAWQAWWLALGAFVAVLAALLNASAATSKST